MAGLGAFAAPAEAGTYSSARSDVQFKPGADQADCTNLVMMIESGTTKLGGQDFVKNLDRLCGVQYESGTFTPFNG